MIRPSKRGLIWAVLLLVVFGLVRLPIEHAIEEKARESGFRTVALDLELRERLTQLTFLAALSGFRALVADVLWMQVYTTFERAEWPRTHYLLETVTGLQPRSTLFWDIAHWHMAFNASNWAYYDANHPREAVRQRARQEYIDIGRDFLERGIRNNPNSGFLWERLGMLLQDKYASPCEAADAFLRASELPDALPYVRRFAAYQMAQCAGREAEAYALLTELYHLSEDNHVPTLIKWIRELEESLEIPVELRIYK